MEYDLCNLFGFTEDAVSVNAGGGLTLLQKDKIESLKRKQKFGFLVAALSFLGTAAMMLVVFYMSTRNAPGALREALPYVTGATTVFILIAAVLMVAGWIRARDVRFETVSCVEGTPKLQKRSSRYGLSYIADIGGEKFYLFTGEQYQAISQNSYWRVFFVRNPPVHTILSLEPLG